MPASLCLMAVLLTAAQLPPSPVPSKKPPSPPPASPRGAYVTGEWFLTPRLVPGQELVYRGKFSEHATGSHLQINRSYAFENRVFTLGVGGRTLDLGVLTVLKDETVPGYLPGDRIALKPAQRPAAMSVRLEKVQLDPQGRVASQDGASLQVPLEGPPLIETGFCLTVPSGRLGLKRPWTTREPGQAEITWQVESTDVVGGASCLKIVGEQHSEDWDNVARSGWRRVDYVWVSPRTGLAHQVERRVEHRTAGVKNPTHTCVLHYEQVSSVQYPLSLAEDRRREILQTAGIQKSALPLFKEPTRSTHKLDLLLAKSRAALDQQAKTPYRDALVSLKQRLEAARRGESPASLLPEIQTDLEPAGPPARMEVGKPAPDFVAPDLCEAGQNISLRKLKGKPILLVFYNPDSRSLDAVMRHTQKLVSLHKDRGVRALAIAMSSDVDRVIKQKGNQGILMPVLPGSGLQISYKVDCTPKIVMIDEEGVVQAVFEGWGSETLWEIEAEVPRWLRLKR